MTPFEKVPLPQQVVLYDPSDGRDKNQVFATFYTAEEGKRTFMRCVSRYGRKANVRSMSARDAAKAKAA